jgi:cytochrome P450
VEELLHYESPLQLNSGLATAPVGLPGGGVIAEGTFVTLGVGAANRDPAVWPDPERLEIGRKPNPQLAFGHGPHACAGLNVSRLKARVAIGRLLERFARIDLRAAPESDPRVRLRVFRRLPVRVR